jgi:hypothetical protein
VAEYDDISAIEKRARTRGLTTFGFVVTGIYLALIGCFAYLRWHEVLKLSPNAMGDALAGAFAPLAFLWLVIGYFQQGRELKQQAIEVSRSVREQAKIAKAAEQQLATMQDELRLQQEQNAREARIQRNKADARLEFRQGALIQKGTEHLWTVEVENRGKDVYEFAATCQDPAIKLACSSPRSGEWKHGTSQRITWLATGERQSGQFEFDILYSDADGEPRTVRCMVIMDGTRALVAQLPNVG